MHAQCRERRFERWSANIIEIDINSVWSRQI